MSTKQLQALIDTLQEQRNVALNTVAQLQGEKAALQEQVNSLEQQIIELETPIEIPKTIIIDHD